MGQILSQPITEKQSESGEDDSLYFGISCMQGWRIGMEDAHAAVLNLAPDFSPLPDAESSGAEKSESSNSATDSATDPAAKVAFFGIYDGHGGDKVAIFTGEHLHSIIARQPAFHRQDYVAALRHGFLSADRAILAMPSMKNEVSGCTATTILVTPDKIYAGNAGDSRTVLAVRGVAKPLSFDHKPSNEGEKSRIAAAGGFVEIGRVNGNLALSRAIGDFEFKKSAELPPEEQMVTAYPDVLVHGISPDDEFVVLACDGIWDCLTSQQVVEFVRREIANREPLEKICELLMDCCLAPASSGSGIGCDNMSVAIIALLQGRTKEEWYDLVAQRVEQQDGPVAPPLKENHVINDMYGLERASALHQDDAEDVEMHESEAMSLRALLAGSNISREGGVIYLDRQSAGSILANLGALSGAGITLREEDEPEDSKKKIEEA